MSISSIRFNKQEFAGSFGDVGTDFPLIVAMILAAGLHAPSVFIVFGLMQIVTGVVYKMPMPVQPLKAMATIVIAQKIASSVLFGAGLAIGAIMFVLSITGILDVLASLVHKVVVRGIQFGLGMSLCSLSFKEYIPADNGLGYGIALCAFVIIIFFIDNRRFPAALVVIGIGLLYAFLFKVNIQALSQSVGISLPQYDMPSTDDILQGLLLLVLPQLPLSLSNSIIATKQVSNDLFPERTDVTVKNIGLTYSFMNLISPFLGGIPVCHGAGGIVGHYTFGGRTGGSVIIYGLLYMIIGLFFGHGFAEVIKVFPLPILGTILFFEGLSLILLMKDVVTDRKGFVTAVIVGLMAFGLPYGFAISTILGIVLHSGPIQLTTLQHIGSKKQLIIDKHPQSTKNDSENET